MWLDELIKRSAPNQIDLAQLRASFGDRADRLPGDYLFYLLRTAGYEGELGGAYVRFYGYTVLTDANRDYAVEEFMSGFLLIGTDGGNRAFGIDLRAESPTYRHYIETDLVGMGWSDVFFTGDSFEALLEHFCNPGKRGVNW